MKYHLQATDKLQTRNENEPRLKMRGYIDPEILSFSESVRTDCRRTDYPADIYAVCTPDPD